MNTRGSWRTDTLATVWEQYRPAMLERVGLIERAVGALTAGELDEELRAEARGAAHTLAGSVGTFGFVGASRAASALEVVLTDPARAQVSALSALVVAVRDGLEGESLLCSEFAPVESTDEHPRVLVVDDDQELCARIAAEAASLGIECVTASSPTQARAVCAERPPTIVLLDLTFPPDDTADAYDFLSELTSMTPPIPVLVLTGSCAFTDRVEAARRGGRAFLSKSLLPSEVLSAATQFLARGRLQRTRVLIVDDDPALLAAMRVLLEAHEIEVCTLADPLRFWETLEEVAPELLILDVDMPGVNGPELCRVVRNDPRWSQIAVIFVTVHKDPATIEGIFQAGADDYLAKPSVRRTPHIPHRKAAHEPRHALSRPVLRRLPRPAAQPSHHFLSPVYGHPDRNRARPHRGQRLRLRWKGRRDCQRCRPGRAANPVVDPVPAEVPALVV